MSVEIFGDILTEKGQNINFEQLSKVLKRPYIKPRFRLYVLNPDESVDYQIPDEDINSISYTEEYQNGQRRNISLTLINIDGKYTPSIEGIWLQTKFKFEVGVVTTGNITVWFPKGIYIMGDITLSQSNSNQTINIQLKDKYAMFEGKWGTLDEIYEIENGSTIQDAINGILNFSLENGYIMDYKPIIFDPSLVGSHTQSTIREDEGGNLGSVIDSLATQLSAEYYYNSTGNLCFYPINSTVDDSVKPIIWTYKSLDRDLHNMELSYSMEEVINVVKVVGDNVDNGIYSAIVQNNNITSPICIQRVGRRVAPKYTESNIWSDELALDLANYYLRQASLVSTSFSCKVGFNPILTVNNLVEVENDSIQMPLKREKLLIESISYSNKDGEMDVKFSNTSDLPSNSKSNSKQN